MSTSSVFAVCSFKNNKLYDLMIWEIRSIYKIGSPHFVCWLVIIDSAAKLLSQNLVSFQWKSVEWKLDPAHDRNRIWDGHWTSCCPYETEMHSKFCFRSCRRVLLSMLVMFIICWLPLNLINLLEDMEFPLLCWSYYYFTFFCLHIFAMASTCCNPLMYGWFSRQVSKYIM